MADTALRHLLRRGCQQVSPRRARRGRSLQDRTSDTTPNRLSRHGGAPFGEEISTYRKAPPNRWYGQTA